MPMDWDAWTDAVVKARKEKLAAMSEEDRTEELKRARKEIDVDRMLREAPHGRES